MGGRHTGILTYSRNCDYEKLYYETSTRPRYDMRPPTSVEQHIGRDDITTTKAIVEIKASPG